MKKLRFVGLDVHKSTVCIAVAEEGRGDAEVLATVPNDFSRVVSRLKALRTGGFEVKCAYEAGPTGFGLMRALTKAGFECTVVAPSRVPDDAQGARRKSDRRDAVRLARYLRSGDLVAIHVPDEECEAMRDLFRARIDAMQARVQVGQQLSSFLLRHSRTFDGKGRWTKKHLAWIATQVASFPNPAQQRVLKDYLDAWQTAQERELKLQNDVETLSPTWSLYPLVQALMALRGVDVITAVTLVSEVGDFARFAKAPEFSSYVGITPSEHSSGERRRQGGITLAGNRYVRRVLVESAWHYCRTSSGAAARKRAEATTPEARAIARKAQDRLHRRFAALMVRGKPKNKVVVSVARELACFVWAIANDASVKSQLTQREAA